MSDIKFINKMVLCQAHLCKFSDANKKAFPNNEFNKREFYYIFKIRKAFQELKNKKSNYILQYNSYTEIIKIINEHNSEILSFHRNFLSNKTNRTTERPYIWHLFHDVSTLDNISSFYSPYNVSISGGVLSGHQLNITNYYEIRQIIDFIMKNKILHLNIIEIKRTPFFIKSIKFKKL